MAQVIVRNLDERVVRALKRGLRYMANPSSRSCAISSRRRAVCPEQIASRFPVGSARSNPRRSTRVPKR